MSATFESMSENRMGINHPINISDWPSAISGKIEKPKGAKWDLEPGMVIFASVFGGKIMAAKRCPNKKRWFKIGHIIDCAGGEGEVALIK